MAQAKEATTTKEQDPKPKGAVEMPPGSGPVEYRMRPGVHLAQAGSVVKEAWIGMVCGRSVRVYRGAPDAALPAEVRKAVRASGIEIGRITYEELGLAPPGPAVGIVNLTQQPETPQG
jgi:hypothetical protein